MVVCSTVYGKTVLLLINLWWQWKFKSLKKLRQQGFEDRYQAFVILDFWSMCAYLFESLTMLLQMICIETFYEFSSFKDSLWFLWALCFKEVTNQIKVIFFLEIKSWGTVFTAYRATVWNLFPIPFFFFFFFAMMYFRQVTFLVSLSILCYSWSSIEVWCQIFPCIW